MKDKELYVVRSGNSHKVNLEAFEENPELKEKYAAAKYAVSANTADYYVKPQASQSAAATAAEAATSSGGPLTRAAKQASGIASRRGSFSEPSGPVRS